MIKHKPSEIKVAIADNITAMKCARIIPDRAYIKMQYYLRMDKKLDFNEPKTFNEKLQWLKLYDRENDNSKYVDKYLVREYVARTIGEEYLIPLLGVWDDASEIDFDTLPDQFVLKCTHDSNSVIICTDKKSFDRKSAHEKLKKKLRTNFYYYAREWPYKNIKPRIICEAFMEDKETAELRDYKFFCFDGVPKAMFIATDRQNEEKDTAFDFYDIEGHHMNVKQGHPNADSVPELPKNFVLMKQLAERLSSGFPHVRIDFYEINGKVFFGEITFFHFSGLMRFIPDDIDYVFGDWLTLPDKKVR